MQEPRRYVIAYDIESDRTRERVATLLEGCGFRVQQSVFECLLEDDDLERLSRSLTRELEGSNKSGDVRIYRLCANCFRESFGLGEVEAGAGAEPWIVV